LAFSAALCTVFAEMVEPVNSVTRVASQPSGGFTSSVNSSVSRRTASAADRAKSYSATPGAANTSSGVSSSGRRPPQSRG
jgi:hypothetical protein